MQREQLLQRLKGRNTLDVFEDQRAGLCVCVPVTKVRVVMAEKPVFIKLSM